MPVHFALTLAFLHVTSMRAGRVLLALYALELGASPLTVGVLAATFSVFPALLSVPAGQLADRYGSRWLMAFGAIAGGAGMLFPYASGALWAIFVAAALNGLAFSIYNVALQNVVGLVSAPDDRTRNFSNYSLANSLGSFAGPLLAGFWIHQFSHAAASRDLALFTLIPAMLLVGWGRLMPGPTVRAERAAGGLLAMFRVPGVRRTLATSSLLQAGQDLFQFYLPVYAHGIGLSAAATGVVLAMNSAAAFVARAWLPRLLARFGEARVLGSAFYLGAAALVLLPFCTHSALLSAIAFAFGLGMGCGGPIVTMLMFGSSRSGNSGAALGLRMTVNHLTRLTGPIAFGMLASALGLAAVFWANAVLLGAGGVLSARGADSRRP